MNDLQQISFDLKHITGRSLLLIDEFGKGTSEHGASRKSLTNIYIWPGIDGIGLACGILEHLLSLEDAPKVIAATHFHEILENEFLRVKPRLQLGHMEVRVCEESQGADDQITYLYKFVWYHSEETFNILTRSAASAWVVARRVLVRCTSLPCHLLSCSRIHYMGWTFLRLVNWLQIVALP